MVPGTVQRIVDVIGEQVERPVLVEDPALHVVAYSEHDRDTDTVRRNSILERHTTQDVVAWCQAAGVHASRTPVRVRPNRTLDFRSRVCVPVYSHELHLGYVWFIDDSPVLTDAELSGIDNELAHLSDALYEEHAHPAGIVESGIDSVLRYLESASVDVRTLHPGVARLVDGAPAHDQLLETLESYLDSAGNAAATSARLHLHRTTLYYRLQRIEEIAGTDLKDGTERLCLHLAVKLRRHGRPVSDVPGS